MKKGKITIVFILLIMAVAVSMIFSACGNKGAEGGNELEYLTAGESDFDELERMFDEIPELSYANFNYKSSTLEDVIWLMVPGYDDAGYRFFFDDDELVTDSKDPENRFEYGHYKVPEENLNWIATEIFNIDTSSNVDSEYVYNKDGYYYIISGDAGLITYETKVADYEQSEDGIYHITAECEPYEANEDMDESEEISIVAGLKYVNGIKQWTFYEIDGIDLSKEIAVAESEPNEETEAEVEVVSTTPADIVNKFVGSWYDLYSSRCGMEITYDKTNDRFNITIKWGSAYNVIAVWSLRGKYDSSINGIAYTGENYNEIYDDNGNMTKNYDYTNGSGKIYFKSDGYIYWQDNVQGAGNDCYFGRQ